MWNLVRGVTQSKELGWVEWVEAREGDAKDGDLEDIGLWVGLTAKDRVRVTSSRWRRSVCGVASPNVGERWGCCLLVKDMMAERGQVGRDLTLPQSDEEGQGC